MDFFLLVRSCNCGYSPHPLSVHACACHAGPMSSDAQGLDMEAVGWGPHGPGQLQEPRLRAQSLWRWQRVCLAVAKRPIMLAVQNDLSWDPGWEGLRVGLEEGLTT